MATNHIPSTSHITWTRKKRDDLRDAILIDKRQGAKDTELMVFQGHTFVVGYAKYLLQYLDTMFKDESVKSVQRQVP